jgi:hypothetical protein
MARRTRKKRKTKKKKKITKKKTKKIKCAPKKRSEALDYTCYSPKTLHQLKRIWNLKHPDIKIVSNKPYDIWYALNSFMKYTCQKETCWLKQKFIKNKINKKTFNKTFRPYSPKSWKKKPTEWLSSLDIINVMKQYEDKFENFQFIGPSPIDYDSHEIYGECVWEELCKFDLSKQKKKNMIGVIFNLDPHYKPGSHWVAIFINGKKRKIYYMDSYGDKAPRRIMRFMKTVKEQSMRYGKPYKIETSKLRHQFSNTECGMFSLYFIVRMLYGDGYKKFMKQKVTDKKMKEMRKIYFNEK